MNHDHLRALAQAAPNGPWCVDPDNKQAVRRPCPPHRHCYIADACGPDAESVAAFIAAFSPDVVLGLLDRIDMLERVILNAQELADGGCSAEEISEALSRIYIGPSEVKSVALRRQPPQLDQEK